MHLNANQTSGASDGLRARRIQLGVSQERLARRVGCSTSMVRLVEQGYAPRSDMPHRIDAALTALEAEGAPGRLRAHG